MSHGYISAAAVADLVMPLCPDSEGEVALRYYGYPLSDFYDTEALQCRWETIKEILMQSTSCRHNAHNMYFTIFVTFSDLLWKNTAEAEELVLAEVCSCDLSKKIHFLHHGKNETKTKHFLTR